MSDSKKVNFGDSLVGSVSFGGFSFGGLGEKSKNNSSTTPVKIPTTAIESQLNNSDNTEELIDENAELENDGIITPDTPQTEKSKISQSVSKAIEKKHLSAKEVAASQYLTGGFAYIENQYGITVFKEESQFNLLQREVCFTYGFSRGALYDALALAYCWYHIAKKNEAHLRKTFGGTLPEDTNATHRSVIKACFELGDKAFKSKVTQYGQVLDYLERHCDKDKLLKPTDDTVSYLSGLIADCKGVSKCVKKLKDEIAADKKIADEIAGIKSPPPEPTKDEKAASLIETWQSSTDVKKEFDYPENVELEENKIVIMCGRMASQKIEVLEVVSDDELAKVFAKKLLELNK